MKRRLVTLTRRGWTVAGAAVGLLVGGRLLGADELTVLGLAALTLIVLCGAWIATTRPALTVTRRVTPARLHVGDVARVDLEVTTTRATALIDLTETAEHLRAQFLLEPLGAGSSARCAYVLPAERRGPFVLGPTTATRADPLGLTRRLARVAPTQAVLVRPRVFVIAAPESGAGRQRRADDTESPGAPAHEAAGEFLAVRPYEVGDDPRRVHWRSSARVGDLMVRQYVLPRRGHTTVVLDTRAAGPSDEAAGSPATSPEFEYAVEAVASIVAALARAHRPTECITTAGTVITSLGTDPRRAVDRLATVMMDEPDRIDAITRNRRRHGGELVIVVTAQADLRIQQARHRLARRSSLLVVTGGDVTDGPGPVVDARRVAFPDAWRAGNPAGRIARARRGVTEAAP